MEIFASLVSALTDHTGIVVATIATISFLVVMIRPRQH